MVRVRGHRKRGRSNLNVSAASGSIVKEEIQDESPGKKNDINLYTKSLGNIESVCKVSTKTFEYICSLVRDKMMAGHTCFNKSGEPMSLYDQVAVALRRLASGEPATDPSDGSSDITWRFVECMEESGLKHIKWPSNERDMKDVKSRFEKFCGLPNCCGVIDATHFEVCLASTSAEHSLDVWLDHNNKYSMVMQAIIGPDMKFMDIVVGWPGSMTESLVFEHSNFKKVCDTGDRLMGNKLKLSKGPEISEYIIGDSGYPLLPYLVVPYEGNEDDLSVAETKFNKVHDVTSLAGKWIATIPIHQHESFQRALSSLAHFPGKLPRRSPIPQLLQAKHA